MPYQESQYNVGEKILWSNAQRLVFGGAKLQVGKIITQHLIDHYCCPSSKIVKQFINMVHGKCVWAKNRMFPVMVLGLGVKQRVGLSKREPVELLWHCNVCPLQNRGNNWNTNVASRINMGLTTSGGGHTPGQTLVFENYFNKYKWWRPRLSVRTRDFHSRKRGSIPLGATKQLEGCLLSSQ